MNRDTYINLMSFIGQRNNLKRFIMITNKVLTLLVYVFYPCFILYLFFKGHEGAYRAVLVPGVSFVFVSVFRKILNAPRPYEVFDYPSVITKDTKGKSFPSRHVFSIFIIGFTTVFYMPQAGVVILCMGVILAVMRVLGGVHFTKDVLAGLAFALFFAIIGFYLV